MSGTFDGLGVCIHGPCVMLAFTAVFYALCHVGALLMECSYH